MLPKVYIFLLKIIFFLILFPVDMLYFVSCWNYMWLLRRKRLPIVRDLLNASQLFTNVEILLFRLPIQFITFMC